MSTILNFWIFAAKFEKTNTSIYKHRLEIWINQYVVLIVIATEEKAYIILKRSRIEKVLKLYHNLLVFF